MAYPVVANGELYRPTQAFGGSFEPSVHDCIGVRTGIDFVFGKDYTLSLLRGTAAISLLLASTGQMTTMSRSGHVIGLKHM